MDISHHKWSTLTILICILVFSLYKILKSTPEGSLRGTRLQDSYFVLKQVHRHGVGQHYRNHQKLDITEELAFEAGALFQKEEMRLTQESNDEEETLWSKTPKYRTENPFLYQFHIDQLDMSMKKMVNSDPIHILNLAEEIVENNDKMALVEWIDETLVAPNVTDKESVIALALMSSDAYVQIPYTGDWRNVTEPWNDTESIGFGWDGTGLRGHVFYNEIENIVVLSIKGTSAQGLPGIGDDETTASDKLNDNLLFSCCCGRVSYLWNTVCDCYIKSKTCDESCLEKELRREDRYYQAVIDIYMDVLEEHPNAAIWLTGHSLGGALASLVGRTFGHPVVAFEAPGELLASKRLHLPFPPGLPSYLEGVWHFGHTADPIFIGTCNGASSSCSIAGYAMETSCHTGKVCIYDVVKDKGWHVNMLNHRIHTVIDQILTEYNGTAKCYAPEPCIDCYNWKFWRNKDQDPSKFTTKTTSTSATTTTTISASTSFCLGRNWLGICTEWSTPTNQNPNTTTR